MSAAWGRERASNNADKSGQGEREGGLPVCGCPFQRVFKGHVMILFRCSTMENRNSLRKYFKELLFFDSFCSSLIVFQFSVRTDRGRVKQEVDRHGQGERGR